MTRRAPRRSRPTRTRQALARFAEAVDVITFEFENVPTACVEFLSERKPVRPGARALALTQDRLVEKNFLRDLGLETAPFIGVEDSGALARAVGELGRPAILKTRRFGYDGKGQALIREGSNVSAMHRTLGGEPMILEGFVVVRARGLRHRRAQPGRRGRRLRPLRERARAPYPGAHARARARRARPGGQRQGDREPHTRGARLCRRRRRRDVRRARTGKAPSG